MARFIVILLLLDVIFSAKVRFVKKEFNTPIEVVLQKPEESEKGDALVEGWMKNQKKGKDIPKDVNGVINSWLKDSVIVTIGRGNKVKINKKEFEYIGWGESKAWFTKVGSIEEKDTVKYSETDLEELINSRHLLLPKKSKTEFVAAPHNSGKVGSGKKKAMQQYQDMMQHYYYFQDDDQYDYYLDLLQDYYQTALYRLLNGYNRNDKRHRKRSKKYHHRLHY